MGSISLSKRKTQYSTLFCATQWYPISSTEFNVIYCNTKASAKIANLWTPTYLAVTYRHLRHNLFRIVSSYFYNQFSSSNTMDSVKLSLLGRPFKFCEMDLGYAVLFKSFKYWIHCFALGVR